MSKHDTLYEQAVKARQSIHGELSVSAEDTLASLRGLRDEIDILVEAVEGDLS